MRGRLYLRPAGDIDPNAVLYEVAQTHMFISIANQSNIVISAWSSGTTIPMRAQRAITRGQYQARALYSRCRQLLRITIKNSSFYDVADAIEARLRRVGEGGSKGQVMDNIVISDNDVRNASGAGVLAVLDRITTRYILKTPSTAC